MRPFFVDRHINLFYYIFNLIIFFLLFRVVEVHRTCEATATPLTIRNLIRGEKEGASLSESLIGVSNNKGM